MKLIKHCKDCEPAQQIHWVAYTSVVLAWITEPISNFMDRAFGGFADWLTRKCSLPFYNALNFLHLGHYESKPSDKDTGRTKCFWEEAIRRGINMREFYIGPVGDCFVAEYKGKKLVFDGLPRPGVKESPALDWMDNKGIMKGKFQKEGIPVAKGGTAFTTKKALEIYNSLEKPVITKPNLGSRSRHTLIHIDTPELLIYGFKKAKALSPLVVIEEELVGSLFRGTLVGGKLVGVVRRDPPQVYGDGVHTLQQLIDKENERPARQGPIFHHITIDKDSEVEIARQNVTLASVIENGRKITISQKTSRGIGGSTTEVSDIVHPDNTIMLEHVGKYLNDPLVGLDFIMEDITKSWHDQPRSGIIECNSLPFIDLHHYPLDGAPNNIAGKLWDYVMPESHKD